MINSNCDLKITDFGSVIELGDQCKNEISYEVDATTLWYRSPEILMKTKQYSTATDIWSIGCIMGELIGGKPIFKGCDATEQLSLILDVNETLTQKNSEVEQTVRNLIFLYSYISILKLIFSFFKKLSQNSQKDNCKPKKLRDLIPGITPVAYDLLTRMLTFDVEKRISVDEALRHPYFEDLHDSEDEPTAENVHKFPKIQSSSQSNLIEFRSSVLKQLQQLNQL